MKLRACPFCRSRNVGVRTLEEKTRLVMCDNCGACGPVTFGQSKKLAADRWNTRAVVLDELPDGIQELIARVPPSSDEKYPYTPFTKAEFNDFMQNKFDSP